MTAHDNSGDKDPFREDAGHGSQGHDALAAALFDEPPPEGVREDAGFLAARDAALADLAVLREQLTLIGDALAGREEAAPAGERPAEDAGAAGPRPARTAPATPLGRRPRLRPLKPALGGLAAAAAASLVLGLGWLVSQNGTTAGSADRGVASDAGSGADAKEDAGSRAFGTPGYLACARLVAEGEVTAVERVPGAAGTSRITVRATRYYKGDGPVAFLRDAGEVPLRPGDRVLVGTTDGGPYPDTVVTGEEDIALLRAGLAVAASESRGLACG
ncbi:MULTISPECIES: hypothetical protein [Streptomyces]|uniref:hypothetical protein n=1 Tax=Streptomyces TaxID=1883 RepID=UPI001F5F5D7D|nr:hypothetical protein [Streptomyces sp. GB4-14]